jgi:hypothetical protein
MEAGREASSRYYAPLFQMSRGFRVNIQGYCDLIPSTSQVLYILLTSVTIPYTKDKYLEKKNDK